jgi:Spy/CpxP family protein refolding chaperone
MITIALGAAMLATGAMAQTSSTDQSNNSTATQPEQGKHHFGRRHHGGMNMKKMAEKLNLSQQQQDQLKPIFEKQHEQMRAIWQDNSLSKDQKKEKMQALRQDFQTQINGVLTPDQQQQWQQMREQMKHRRHHGEDQAPTQPQS